MGGPETPPQSSVTLDVLQNAANKALCGGLAGVGAQGVNVVALMWMQTVMNVQYRYGGTFKVVATRLYAEGGCRRFYQGFAPAIVLAPLSRFGDVAANEGALAALESTRLPIGVQTAFASACAASGRLFIMPLDAWKTTKQVQGANGLKQLMRKFNKHPLAPWHGGLGAVAAAWTGHYPWFVTHNVLRVRMPQFEMPFGKHVRHALIGFLSSMVSDVFSNSLRVLKTTRQVSVDPIGYAEAARMIIATDGYLGLFGRGLKTRIAAKGLQGALFSVGWQATQEMLERRGGAKALVSFGRTA